MAICADPPFVSLGKHEQRCKAEPLERNFLSKQMTCIRRISKAGKITIFNLHLPAEITWRLAPASILEAQREPDLLPAHIHYESYANTLHHHPFIGHSHVNF
ncbi:hypothetical protein CGRA01v4_05764 [Colletotrichum graminicola]|nr:hypothetical protein CGRA01v4_05764 [Colletotrichum graminicola]